MPAYIDTVPYALSVIGRENRGATVGASGSVNEETRENDVFDLIATHEYASALDRDALRDFYEDNRAELVEIDAPDGATYEGYFAQALDIARASPSWWHVTARFVCSKK